MAAKKRNPRFVTPRGVFSYPWLNKPDTKFNASGVYKVDLILTAEQMNQPLKHKNPEFNGKSLMTLLDEANDANYEARLKDAKPQDRKKMSKEDAYESVFDDEGNETGNYRVKFKLNAKVEPKGKDAFTQKPDLLDAHKKPTKVQVWGGSEGKIIFEIVPYLMASTKTAGLSLRMKAVQILKLSEGSNSYDDLLDDEEGFEDDDSGDEDGDLLDDEAPEEEEEDDSDF